MFNKHKASRDLETKADAVTGGIRAFPAPAEQSKLWDELCYCNPNWSTFKSFETRFNKLAAVMPEIEVLRPHLEEAKILAAQLAEFAASEKARLKLKREKAAEPKPVMESGAKLDKADPEIVKSLFEALIERRNHYVSHHVQQCSDLLNMHLEQARAGTFGMFNGKLLRELFHQYGLYRDTATHSNLINLLETPATCERFLKAEQAVAEFEFDSYIVKLAIKVTREGGTKVVSAEVSGSVWEGIVRVETDVNYQVWHTQCIINTSVLGKAYNQWPTTLKKLTAK